MVNGQRGYEVELPIGFLDTNNLYQRSAVLRKMCGYDEELLFDESLNAGRFVTELLGNCLVKLGDQIEVDVDMVSKLYTADRNYLLLELQRITFGSEVETSYVCPSCSSGISIVENLKEVVVNRVETDEPISEISLTLEDGYFDRENNHHRDLSLTLPRGVDEEFVAPLAAKDPLKAQDALLLRCISKFGELSRNTLDSYGIKILRELTMGDRRAMRQSLSRNVPGVDLRRQIHCGSCGHAFEGTMDVSNFFVAG